MGRSLLPEMGCQNLQFWALANQRWVDARVLGPATSSKMMQEKSRRRSRMNLAEAQMRHYTIHTIGS